MRVLRRSSHALLVTAAIVAAALGAACSSEEPTDVSQVPLAPSLSISSIPCDGIPNGGVTGVFLETGTTDPITGNPTSVIHQVYTPKRDTVYAHVFRDDPNSPGEQLYCEDNNATVTFTNEGNAPYTGYLMTNVHPRDVTIYNANDWSSGPYWKKLVGTAGTKKDTSFVHSQF